MVIYLYLQFFTSYFLLNVYVAKKYMELFFQEEDLYLNELSQTICAPLELKHVTKYK